MKAKVIDSMCIGCGACVATVPEEFDFNDEGLSFAVNETVNASNEDKVKDAANGCPTSAIKIEEKEQ